MTYLLRLAATIFMTTLLAACGGGGGGSDSPAPAATQQFGGLTVTLGDAPFNADAVFIDIEEVRLLGDGEQQHLLTLETDAPIDLLTLQNITELLFDGEVPVGEYSKIRLIISSLSIVVDGVSEDAQLPANGKIDLVPQGSFDILPGEDLVIQIDIDLERSVHIVQTGNSKYRFRPVVFVDVIDQDQLRLVHLFGNVEEDAFTEGQAPEAEAVDSDFDLCETVTEIEADECSDIDVPAGALVLAADGTNLGGDWSSLLGTTAHVFGHYFVDADGNGKFRAVAIAGGAEDSLAQFMGPITDVAALPDFNIQPDSDAVDPEQTVMPVVDAKILDEFGVDLAVAIEVGQEADVWAQNSVLAAAAENTIPAFLVQIAPASDDESLSGDLIGFDAMTREIEIMLADSTTDCIVVDEGTLIQLISDFGADATNEYITEADLAEIAEAGETPSVQAFGSRVSDEACLNADVLVIEE